MARACWSALDKLFAELSTEEIAALQEPWVGSVLDKRNVWHETLLYGLNALGIPVDFALNECAAGATNLVVGAHLLDTDGLAALPSDAILYNSEQIDESSSWMQPAYLAALQRHSVWDYGAENVRRLRARGACQVRHVPLGYVPQLTRIPVLQPEE